jgi:hypothetical protein
MITTPTIERAFAMLHKITTLAAALMIILLCGFISKQIATAIDYWENNNP